MKFHHLARRNQFVAAQQQHLQHSQQRDLSPIKQQHQVAMQQQQMMQNLTDDEEDEEYIDNRDYFNQQQQQQLISAANKQHSDEQQPLDTSGFLMDKNKKLFPQKLWELIHNPSIQHCLRWSQDGQRVYLNRNEFETYYLKTPNNQFHTQKAISFVRQMNMYGFRKVDDCYYENDNFRRDRKHLLRNMIRRHPNKGLFAGLDHHQLAAAAAAQQAIQANHQLQQLEHQHKHRTEQALRLNNYLNNHHQFYQATALVNGGHSHQIHNPHSTPFDLPQLARAAANHLSQQQQHLHHQQQQQTICNNNIGNNLDNQSTTQPAHQPKKSRLLNDFYATSTTGNSKAVSNRNTFADNNQDSMHSNSSLDTQPSQCSSVVNSGSAGSPQPNSPNILLHQRLVNLNGNQNCHQNSQSVGMKVAKELPHLQEQFTNKFGSSNNISHQLAATDLSNQQLSNRQALHQTLVRSLLQLKQNPQDLLASLQQQNPRVLLESLASLSSASTGSIVDPTSNSPTERTSSPLSAVQSPSFELDTSGKFNSDTSQFVINDNNNMALNLAKSSTPKAKSVIKRHSLELNGDEDNYAIDIEKEEVDGNEEIIADDDDDDEVLDASPLDGQKKVRRFLDTQIVQKMAEKEREKLKREMLDDDDEQDDIDLEGIDSQSEKRVKRSHSGSNNDTDELFMDDNMSISSIARSLIIELCDRRGDQLDTSALNEAARYTECFLEILLDDATLIARHSSTEDLNNDEVKDSIDTTIKKGNSVDSSSLSLALKLIPSKLIAAIQQQVTTKTQA